MRPECRSTQIKEEEVDSVVEQIEDVGDVKRLVEHYVHSGNVPTVVAVVPYDSVR